MLLPASMRSHAKKSWRLRRPQGSHGPRNMIALPDAAGAAGNYPKAIAHGLAAAAHGVAVARYRSAGKGGGGGAVRPSAGAVDQVARGADTRGGGNVTINAPPGFLIGTPAQLAAELRRLQLAGAGTGL